MLDIWILNVGQGDAIILRYQNDSEIHFGVIDSNHTGSSLPRVLIKLKEIGAKSLSFIALTHPHADHYTGLSDIIDYYKNKINEFYFYPIGNDFSARFEELCNVYKKSFLSTTNKNIKWKITEFLTILALVKKHIKTDDCHELTGEYNGISPTGFSGTEIFSILPPAKVRGKYYQAISSGDISLVGGREEENDLSLAFVIRYKGNEIILGGDGTHNNWLYQKRIWDRACRTPSASIVKLPHHGSKYECKENTLKYLYGNQDNRVAIISANGKKHPDLETLQILKKLNIKPYCTNLSKYCGANVKELKITNDVEPKLSRYLNSVAENSNKIKQPCQGDILINIDENGTQTIMSEHQHPCPYRDDYVGLFPSGS